MASGLFSRREVKFDSREGVFLFMALIVMLFAICRVLAVGLHEFMGHGLFTELVGGEFYAAYISPGNGYASIRLPDDASKAIISMAYLAGISVEIISGLIILAFVHPRMKTFTSGIFTLVMAEVLLVHSSLYLVLGAYNPSGDSYLAGMIGGIEVDVLVILGLILALLFILIVSIRFLQFISEFEEFKNNSQATRALGLFWLPPTLVILASVLLPMAGSLPDERAYSMIYGLLVLTFVLIAMFYIPKIAPRRFSLSRREGMRFDKVIGTLGVFILVIVIWLAVFGPSSEDAHGLMIKDPPIEAERFYRDYTVGNAIVNINSNGTMEVSILLKGVMQDPSPLDEKLYESFEQRPNWPDYTGGARNMLRMMFFIPNDVASNISFDQKVEGGVWGGGQVYDNARVSSTMFNLSDMGMDFDDDGNLTIFLADPWMIGSNPGYLDSVEFRWEENLTLVDHNTGNITPTYFNEDGKIIIWRNHDLASAPAGYRIVFQRD